NLFENALNYSFAKGSVTICFEEHPSSYLFVIQDTGIGISKEEQSRIFERFYRADKARSRLVGGSGIGLAIVKDYVARLEGTITLESYLGVGSRFEVQLPKTLKDHS
ncbi:MAG: two-component sensor histidine kinase, partial [Enterococcus sp.]|nr:two-component sensor histidine kinase [Enterococcus sp.]